MGLSSACGEGQAWTGAVAVTCASWNLPPSDHHLSRAAHEDVQPFQCNTNILHCYCPSCPAECILITSETDFRANPGGAEFQGEESW